MDLNGYKEQAKEFLIKINALDESAAPKIRWLEQELRLLKDAVETNQQDKIRHQIYDMLYLLFEMAAEYDFDLVNEWDAGKEKKRVKYK